MTVKKVRLDVLVVERGLVETREQAKRSIMAGLVFSGSNRMDKP
ncbi:MAG: TlyA family rRNA (cytidine-2'-O)-methyltransferase, partial [Amphibacillus sp.]|nr:TlyA family rRNA (cytidine-2'-O)-methyltransferase [Amphibacillus sp.]